MSKPTTFVISLTEVQFNTIMEKMKAAGQGPTSLEGGTLPEEDGVQLSYVVGKQATNGLIPVTFTILKKPFIVSAAFVESKVQQMIAGA